VTTAASDPNKRAEASTLAEQAFVRLRFISLSLLDEHKSRYEAVGVLLSLKAAVRWPAVSPFG
jgi:hypothetical protein